MDRISTAQISNAVGRNIQANYVKLYKLQEQLSTGRRLNRPSDDPVEMKNNLELKARQEQISQHHRNIENGLSWLNMTQDTLTNMNDIIQRLRELAIQGGNDTNGAKERLFISKEVRQLMEQMVTIIDTSFCGDYLFSGSRTDLIPYEHVSSLSNLGASPPVYDYNGLVIAAGGQAQMTELLDYQTMPIKRLVPGTVRIYDSASGNLLTEGADYEVDYGRGYIRNLTGAGLNVNLMFDHYRKRNWDDGGEINREIEQNITCRINLSATEVFYDTSTDTDAIGYLVNFVDALESNDGKRVRDAITNLDRIQEQVLGAQSLAGARVNRFELTRSRNEYSGTETTRLQSEIEDVDLAEATSQFSLQQTIFTASLQAGAKIIMPTLGDYIR